MTEKCQIADHADGGADQSQKRRLDADGRMEVHMPDRRIAPEQAQKYDRIADESAHKALHCFLGGDVRAELGPAECHTAEIRAGIRDPRTAEGEDQVEQPVTVEIIERDELFQRPRHKAHRSAHKAELLHLVLPVMPQKFNEQQQQAKREQQPAHRLCDDAVRRHTAEVFQQHLTRAVEHEARHGKREFFALDRACQLKQDDLRHNCQHDRQHRRIVQPENRDCDHDTDSRRDQARFHSAPPKRLPRPA